MSAEDNLPPEEGPFDEDAPLLRGEDTAADKEQKKYLIGAGLLLLIFILLITTCSFAALYFHLLKVYFPLFFSKKDLFRTMPGCRNGQNRRSVPWANTPEPR